jgi:hypothetical protein
MCCSTIGESVTQARAALRAFRLSIKDRAVQKADPNLPFCCRVSVPQPHPENENTTQLLQEGEFPGGVLQKFRKLRPCVEDLLFGCEPLGATKLSSFTSFAGAPPAPFASGLFSGGGWERGEGIMQGCACIGVASRAPHVSDSSRWSGLSGSVSGPEGEPWGDVHQQLAGLFARS